MFVHLEIFQNMKDLGCVDFVCVEHVHKDRMFPVDVVRTIPTRINFEENWLERGVKNGR